MNSHASAQNAGTVRTLRAVAMIALAVALSACGTTALKPVSVHPTPPELPISITTPCGPLNLGEPYLLPEYQEEVRLLRRALELCDAKRAEAVNAYERMRKTLLNPLE
jgi:hypothetical protein